VGRHGAGEDAALSLLRILKAFCLAPPQAQHTVLADFFVPDVGECSPELEMCLEVAQMCLECCEWAKPFDLAQLRRIILVYKCNAHSYNHRGVGGAAIFPVGSKTNHSCNSNVFYSSTFDPPRGCWIARRDIQRGEELFLSYVTTSQPAPLRGRLLREQYLFQCSCELCAFAIDVYRGLPCPACLPRQEADSESIRCLSPEAETAAGGFVFKDMQPGVKKPWECDRCGSCFTEHQLGLSWRWEERLQQEVQMLDGGSGPDRDRVLLQHHARCRQILGPMHWCTKRVQYLLCLHIVSERFVTRQGLDQLGLHIEELWHWLERGAKYCAPAAYLEVILRRASELFFRFGRPATARDLAKRCWVETAASCGKESSEMSTLQAILEDW